jgi:dihydrofolate reductase
MPGGGAERQSRKATQRAPETTGGVDNAPERRFADRVFSDKVASIFFHGCRGAGPHYRSVAMRRLIVSTFVSLDGIMQAPGGPEEDPTGGFTLGGWTFNYWDEAMDISVAGFDGKGRELVLGRRTYEIFEAYWPYQPEDDPIARTLNAVKKHVASRTLTALHWNNSTLLRGDVVPAVSALKELAGPDLQVIGSGNLIQTLQAASLVDEYNVWTFPLVLGRGKRLFDDAVKPFALRLVHSKVSTTGVVMSTYVPSGDVRPGSFASVEPSEKELARRQRMANETW